MRSVKHRLIVAVLLTALASACVEAGLGIPTTPSGPSLGGTWLGSFTSTSGETRTATVTLNHWDALLSGLWTMAATRGTTSGDLTGTLVGSTAFLTLRPYDRTACTMSLVAADTTLQLAGTWSTRDCEDDERGTFLLSRL